MIKVYPKLSKDYILSQVTQEEIFESYLQIKIPNSPNEFINSPLRADTNASVSFKYGGLKLRMRDWAGYFWGDCFDLVGHILGVDTKSKDGFIVILTDICRTFGLREFEGRGRQIPRMISSMTFSPLVKLKPTRIDITKREWNKNDAAFWNRFKVLSLGVLKKEFVTPCEHVWLNYEEGKNPFYNYNYKDPCYYYHSHLDGADLRGQLYFPYRTREHKRFIINHTRPFGLRDISCNEMLIITKSMKDLMVLRELVKMVDRPVDVIALTAEGNILDEELYNKLWAKYDLMVSFFDFDFTGRNGAWKHRNLYNIVPIFLTDGRRGSKVNYKAKDISAYVENNPLEMSLGLIEKTYQYLKKKYL